MIEAELREHFGEAATTYQPPTAISTGAAKQRARRSLRRRRASAATLSVGTVVAAVLVATLAGPSSGASRLGTAGQTSLQARGPAAFDVATSRLRFAWLPPGIRVASQTSSATGLSASLAVHENEAADAQGWSVSMLAAGQCRLSRGTLRCGGQAIAYPSVRAPEVDGGIAYWGNYNPNTNFASLSFEYAAGSWANIVYWSSRTVGWYTHASPSEILHIARGLTLTRGTPVVLPVRLAGLPGWKLIYTRWAWDAFRGGSVSATLTSLRPGRGAAAPSLVITPAGEHHTCAVYPPAQHLTINGHSVVIESQTVYPPGGPGNGVSPELESETLCAPDVGGLMITLSVTGTHTASLTSLFGHLRPEPEASSWTGEPARGPGSG